MKKITLKQGLCGIAILSMLGVSVGFAVKKDPVKEPTKQKVVQKIVDKEVETKLVTPTKVEAKEIIQPEKPKPIIHTVVANDTLNAISETYKVDSLDIQSSNDIVDPTVIHVGQEILVGGEGFSKVTQEFKDKLEQIEQERIALEKAEQERLAIEKAEQEARVKAEQERIANEQAEQEAKQVQEQAKQVEQASVQTVQASPVQATGSGTSGQATAYIATGNLTATGTVPAPSRTIAVDPNVIPLGSQVRIEVPSMPQYNGIYIAEDTGGVVKGNIIDIFVASYDEAVSFGRRDILFTVL